MRLCGLVQSSTFYGASPAIGGDEDLPGVIPGSDQYTYVVEPYGAGASPLLVTYGFADENRIVARCPDGLIADTVETPNGGATEDNCYSLLVEGMADAFYYIDQHGHGVDAVLGNQFNDLFVAVMTSRVSAQAFDRGFDSATQGLATRSAQRVVAAVRTGRAVYLTVATVRDMAARACTAERLGPAGLSAAALPGVQQAQRSPAQLAPPAPPSVEDVEDVEDVDLTMSQEEQCHALELAFHQWFMNELEADEARNRMGSHAAAFDSAMEEMGELTGAPEDEIYGLTGVRKYCQRSLR